MADIKVVIRYVVELDADQVDLIREYLYHTRLGIDDRYKDAAFRLDADFEKIGLGGSSGNIQFYINETDVINMVEAPCKEPATFDFDALNCAWCGR